LDRPRTSSVWKPENDLRSLVEEVRGGVRLGAFNEVSLDVVMKTAEDAAVLAGISRWLPGFIQLQESRSPQSALAALVGRLEPNIVQIGSIQQFYFRNVKLSATSPATFSSPLRAGSNCHFFTALIAAPASYFPAQKYLTTAFVFS